jgi:hypothetical protein
MKYIKRYNENFEGKKTIKEMGKVLEHPNGADEYGDCKFCGGTRLLPFNNEKICTCLGGLYVNKFDLPLDDYRMWDNRKVNKDNFTDIINILERDCKPFLDEVKTNNIGPIFRGTQLVNNTGYYKVDGLYKRQVRQDREPRDTKEDISKLIDDCFEEKFGVRVRSKGVFTTKKKIGTYGTPYLFFPIGEYKYYWNPLYYDLYASIKNMDWYNPNRIKKIFNYFKGSLKNNIKKFIDSYQSDGLKDNKDQEITFICKEYYLVDPAFYSQYLEYLKKDKL